MSQRIVYFNGQFVPEAEARLSIYDSALTMGDMAFEVTRTFRHKPFRLREHLERLAHSLSVIRTDPGMSLDELEQATLATLARNLPTEAPDIDWNILHNISRGPAGAFREAFPPGERGPSVVISCYPLTRKLAAVADLYDSGLDLVVPRQPAIPAELLDPTIKTRSRIHYHLANFQAEDIRPGAWAVLATPDGRLTEGTSGNLFAVLGGELVTPQLKDVLAGVTRGTVLELAREMKIPFVERDLSRSEAAQASELFLTSTSIGILHAHSYEGRAISGGAIGPFTARLRAALDEHVGVSFAAQARLYAARLRAEIAS